jgi:hypothetical protein
MSAADMMPAIYHASEWVEAIAGGSHHGNETCLSGGTVRVAGRAGTQILVEVVKPQDGGGTACVHRTFYLTTPEELALQHVRREWKQRKDLGR